MFNICPICHKEFYVRPCYIRYGRAKTCSKSCSAIKKRKEGKDNLLIFPKGHKPWNTGKKMSMVSGDKHWNWKGGKHPFGQDGYIVVMNKEHPFSDKAGYIPEHRLVMEKKLGRYLKKEERVHHINGIKTDNRIENLMLFKNEREHRKFHLKIIYPYLDV